MVCLIVRGVVGLLCLFHLLRRLLRGVVCNVCRLPPAGAQGLEKLIEYLFYVLSMSSGGNA